MSSVDKKTLCPVCGYELGFEPWIGPSASDEICPSCGIQFGYTDAAGGDLNKRHDIYKQWRNNWITEGMPWDKKGGTKPPDNWDPRKQLMNIGFQLVDKEQSNQ